MENNTIIEEYEDALSLCDFALCDQEDTESIKTDSSQEDFFEFSTSLTSSEPNSATDHNNNDIIFCGKIISCKTGDDDDDHHHHQRNNNPLRFSSSPSPRLLNKNKISSNNSSSKPAALPPQARSSSKKHKAIIGLPKIPSKMELSDLRERQNKKQTAPPPMFPAAVTSEASAVSSDGSSKKSNNWGLLRPFRFRAQDTARMLTRSSSLGCLWLARPCID